MKTIQFLSFLIMMSLGSLSQAQDAASRGLEIAKAAEQADRGFESTSVELEMTLRNKRGQESTRLMTNQTLELDVDGDKSLIVFNSPRDVKGTATLTYTHKEGSDDQWLYLPSIARVKRISSDNKSGPFMGSEFAYEDLSSQEVEKYTYQFLREEKNGNDTWLVVERDPVDQKSGYTRQIVWYNQTQGYRLEQIEFYDRKNALLKTLKYRDYKQYKGKHWRALEMYMVNHQSEKETSLRFSDYKFAVGLSDTDFTQNSLKRASK